jgi:cytidine deaminase
MSTADDELAAAAFAARVHARCAYSGFRVGAALRDASGRIHTGANVENASYNLGLCAERVAMYHALTHAADGFSAIAIASDAAAPTYPCGACRQALLEFAPRARVLLVVDGRIAETSSVAELMPHAFDGSLLGPRP